MLQKCFSSIKVFLIIFEHVAIKHLCPHFGKSKYDQLP